MELSEIPYKHRFSAASLLISKANRLTKLTSLSSGGNSPKKQKSIQTGICFYEMALHLMKPFDPNYSTVLNWRSLALIELGRFEDAVKGYEEIINISDQTDGKAQRNATARLAEGQIKKYKGKPNLPIDKDPKDDVSAFDDPPYCMMAQTFCELLAEGKFKKAQAFMSEELKSRMPLSEVKSEWKNITGKGDSVDIALLENMTEWPNRKENEVGWCYFSVTSEDMNEAISTVVSITEFNTYQIVEIEFGRP